MFENVTEALHTHQRKNQFTQTISLQITLITVDVPPSVPFPQTSISLVFPPPISGRGLVSKVSERAVSSSDWPSPSQSCAFFSGARCHLPVHLRLRVAALWLEVAEIAESFKSGDETSWKT